MAPSDKINDTQNGLQHVFDVWFAPKRFETPAFYKSLGVLIFKKYVPTGGDLANRRTYRTSGKRTIEVKSDLAELKRYERTTRQYESIHFVGFVLYTAFFTWMLVAGLITGVFFGIALCFNLLITVHPIMLQRYNRLRLYKTIRLIQVISGREEEIPGRALKGKVKEYTP